MNTAPSRLASFLPPVGRGCVAVLVSSLFAASGSRAATDTWVGNTAATFSTAANWSNGAPTNGSTLSFGLSGTVGAALTDDITGLSVGGANTDGIDFALSSDAYTIAPAAAQTITLASTGTGIGINDLSNQLITIGTGIVLGSAQTIQVGGATGNATYSDLALNGVVSGAYRLTKTGSGVLNFNTGTSTTNTFSGLTITGGAVVFQSDLELGAVPAVVTPGSIVIDGGALAQISGNNITVSAARGILLGDSGAGTGGTISIYSNRVDTYNGAMSDNGASGGNSLTKTGTGTLALGGTNTYTGATIVNQGTVELNFAATGTGGINGTTPTANIISSSSALTLGGTPTAFGLQSAQSPTLLVLGNNAGLVTASQTFNGVTLNPGNANIVANGGTGSTGTIVALGAITHNPGATVSFTALSNSGGSGGVSTFTTATSNTNGILGGWATYATGSATTAASVALTPTDWAANDGSGNIVAYMGYTDIGSSASAITSNASSNVRVSGTAGAVSLNSGLTDINSLLVSDAATRTITTGSGNTLRLGASGGIFRTSTANTALNIGSSVAQGGTLTAGGANNTAGEIVITNNGISTNTNSITVNSVIADNGTGMVDLVKTGAGALTLSGTNTYSGGTIINQGNVLPTSAGAFGSGPVTFLPGGTMTTSAVNYPNAFSFDGGYNAVVGGLTTTLSGTVTLAGDTGFQASGASTNSVLNITGKLTGAGNLDVAAGAYVLANSSNNFTGSIGIGAIVVAGGSTSGGVPVSNSTLVRLGANNSMPNGAGTGNIYIYGQTTTSKVNGLDMAGFSATINGLNSSGTAAQTEVINSGAAAATLTLGGNNQSSTFGGRMIDTNGASASITTPGGATTPSGGTLAIVKIGTGVFTATGANVYSGGTSVNAGTFRLGAATTMQLSTGTMLVQGGTLDSNFAGSAGVVNLGGPLTMMSGAINPNGASVGMLTLAANNTFTMSGGTLDLTLTSTSSYDTIAGSGTGTISINGGTLDLGGVVGTAGNSYQVLSGFTAGSVAGLSFTDYTTTDGSTPSLSSAGLLSFTITAVPEPSTWAMGCLLSVVMAGYVARRQKKCWV